MRNSSMHFVLHDVLVTVVTPIVIVALIVANPDSFAAERPAKNRPLVPWPETVPAPPDNPTTTEKVELGKQLFFDPRLSGDNKNSCATCHVPDKALTDGLAQAAGQNGKTLNRNTPSLLNVAWQESFFWDGRVGSLEEQALAPIQSADEMNQDLPQLEDELNAVPGYVRQFEKVFGTQVTRDGIAKALAAFQRTLITQPSPVDRYLAGDKVYYRGVPTRGPEGDPPDTTPLLSQSYSEIPAIVAFLQALSGDAPRIVAPELP